MSSGAPGISPRAPITRRELFVLALISLATVLLMAVGAEAATRAWWPEQEANPCYARGDDGVIRPRAHCSARVKNAEGPWTTMSYNECGYRSPHSCGPKPAGARRVVVLGTSIADGLYVPYQGYFAARLERALQQRCRFPVEFQDLASVSLPASMLMPEVLSLRPDAVLLVFNPFDLLGYPQAAGDSSVAERQGRAAVLAAEGAGQMDLVSRLRLFSRESRALTVAQHFMLENEAFLLRAYRLGINNDALTVPVSSEYRKHYAGLERDVVGLQARLASQKIPLILVPVPNRIQAVLMSSRTQLPGVDPRAFAREVRAIAARHDIPVAPVFEHFAAGDGEKLFYVVDGHLTSNANALIADAIQEVILGGTIPGFATCAPSR